MSRRWRRPLTTRQRTARVALAIACAAGAIAMFAAGLSPAQTQQGPPTSFGGSESLAPTGKPDPALVERGRRLFVDGCSSCHGIDARGIRGRAPTLHGVSAAAADFYLRTGRMPLDDPGDQPVRTDSPYSEDELRALIAYVVSLPGGDANVPPVNPERGDLALGFTTFSDTCAGCHQIVGRGGVTGRGIVPDLESSKPIDVVEAIHAGPYLMPHLDKQLSQREIDSVARYVEWAQEPADVGGWGIGHIGPIPEGMVAWLLAGAALLLVIRLIGERTTE